jgi:hypothetical protein
MLTQSRSDGQNQPMASFAQSSASALTISRQALKCHELLVQDTSVTPFARARARPPVRLWFSGCRPRRCGSSLRQRMLANLSASLSHSPGRFSKRPAIGDGCQSGRNANKVSRFAAMLCSYHTRRGKLFRPPRTKRGGPWQRPVLCRRCGYPHERRTLGSR